MKLRPALFLHVVLVTCYAGWAPISVAGSLSPIRMEEDGRLGAAQQVAATLVDDFRVVDCLIPGQIRRLGRSVTYVTRRRAVKTTPSDCEIRGGEYVSYDRANYQTALKVWLPLARKGDPKAQTYVGEIFEKGLGTSPDHAKAADWYRRAAERGYTNAQQNLGHLYEKGLGVPRDPAKAVYWYRRASGLPETAPLFKAPSSDQSDELGRLQERLQRRIRESDSMRRRLGEIQDQLKKSKRELEKRKRLESEQRKKQSDTERELTNTQAAWAKDRRALDERLNQVNREILVSGRKPLEIKLLDPKIVKIRGASIVRVRQGIRTQPIIGRVRFASMVPDVYVNKQKQIITSKGMFRVEIAIRPSGTPVEIVAVDLDRNQVEFKFRLQPAADILGKSPDLETLKKAAGRYFALVIGNNENRYMPKLETAVLDARAVSDTLASQYGFNVVTLLDATRNDILGHLSKLRNKLTEKDNLLIYYAGHGVLDRVNDRGHWLPVDAQPDNRASWISNVDISDHMNLFNAKHILVIADSCYSGALTISAIPDLQDVLSTEKKLRMMKTITEQISRTALTSGGLTPVIDESDGRHSIFAKVLLEQLRNNKEPMEGRRLFRKIFANVVYAASRYGMEQEPQYAPIRYAGHSGGDFVFIPQPK